jgi:thioredoxin-related protein
MNLKRYLFTILLLTGLSATVEAQLFSFEFEQLDTLQKKERRNVFVLIYTDWCRYCASMKNTSLQNDSVVRLLNERFYLVRFNAESKRDISFNGQTFKYRPTGTDTGIHELAEALAVIEGQVSYPSMCMLNDKNEVLFQYNGFLSAQQLISLLTRFKGP